MILMMKGLLAVQPGNNKQRADFFREPSRSPKWDFRETFKKRGTIRGHFCIKRGPFLENMFNAKWVPWHFRGPHSHSE